jgi:hypothetical protein
MCFVSLKKKETKGKKNKKEKRFEGEGGCC